MGKRKLRSDSKKAPADSTPHAPQADLQTEPSTLEQLRTEVQGLKSRLDVIEARVNANNQRFSNFRCIDPSENFTWDRAYVPVVKYIPGHPFLPHPNLDGVEFAQDYPVDSQPPPNLLPTTYGELSEDWMRLTLRQMRQRIRAIFWFYNDQRFQLPSNATKELCRSTFRRLGVFLRYP